MPLPVVLGVLDIEKDVLQKEASINTSPCVSPSLCVLPSRKISRHADSSLGVAGVAKNIIEHHDEVVSGNIRSATPAGGSPVVHGDSPVDCNSGMVHDDGQNPEVISVPASGSLSQCVSTPVHGIDPSGVCSTSGVASSDQSEHDVDVFSGNVGCSTSGEQISRGDEQGRRVVDCK
ncbi:hypothetical protein V6N13_092815 [Hibiscus sabdariffa]